ncbi:MAG TPA: ATP-binding cassette domain-containing protein [Thermoanaerobaculia bacterium]|nr:ATP-binding cassette domain-containing protein [Thermoanaerobaculia bacterium]
MGAPVEAGHVTITGSAEGTSRTSETPSLSADDLSWLAGSLVILQGFDLRLSPGTVTGLIGPNGAGKSTAIDLLSGFRPPASGSVSLLGKDVTHLPADQRTRLGLTRTFQESPTIPGFSVREHVQLAIEASGRRPRKKPQAKELLDYVGLQSVAEASAATLPIGKRRMLDVARALGTAPSVLLLDEPFAGLEREDEDNLTRIIHDLKKDGTAVLIVEHRLALLGEVVETVHVLVEGRPLAKGPLEEVLRDDRVQRAYLKASGPGQPT